MAISTIDSISPAPDSFRLALRGLVGQVSVITLTHLGEETGLTLTSANALSTNPPMLIACINRSASAHGGLALGTVIGWQVLGADQQAVAERFSGMGGLRGAARFLGADWHDDQGAKLLVGANMACAARIESLSDHASHTVVIAKILSLYSAPQAGTLGSRDGAYIALR